MMDFRDRLQGDLEPRYGKLLEAIDNGLSATKKAWVNCPHCKKRSEVEVTDTKAALEAAEFIANQSHGRPGVAADGAESERVKVLRSTIYDGIGPEPFEELRTKIETIVDRCDAIPDALRDELNEYAEDLGDIAEQHTRAA
jgi:hypothetical protein